MDYVAIVTMLALLQALYFAVQVGKQRAAHGVDAPATTGHPDFERAFRIHANTLEQLIMVLPGMWMFATYWQPEIAAGLGLLFIIGRQLYRNAYMGDPKNRAAGFIIGLLATAVLLLGTLVGAVMNLL